MRETPDTRPPGQLVPSEGESAHSPTLHEIVTSVFPGALTEIKIDLKKVQGPMNREAIRTFGQGIADREGVRTTVWEDLSTFSDFTPGSKEPTSG
jgi:hypothetical protein